MKQQRLLNIMLQGLLLSAVPALSMAQGQDADFHWVGNSVHDVADVTDEDQGTVYLYNVGTGKYLNTGSYWGTVVVGFNVGMTTTIKTSATPGYYQMIGPLVTTEGKNIAFGRQMDTPGPDNIINYNRVYVDRGVSHTDEFTHTTHPNGILDWKFTETSPGSKTYYIHCTNDETRAGMGGEIYLTMAATSAGKTYDIEYPHAANGVYSQWKIVTKADLKAAFKETYASNESPADATFLIYDQNFERGNTYVDKWVTSGGLAGTHNAQYIFDPSASGETYYVGNGATRSNYYMATYAGYTTANVRNNGYDSQANGALTQSVKTLKAGWYRVSCNGFYHADTNSSMVSKAFAKVQGTTAPQSNVEAPLDQLNTADVFAYTVSDMTHVYNGTDLENNNVSPYIKAGKMFAEGKYENTLLVYVPHDGDILNIGIEISGSTEDLDWTAFDNFQLKYCGDNDMVLDEGQTSLDYLTKQELSPNNAYTLILKRTMTVGKWNSITLPVALTAAQFKTAFGDQAKLARLKGQDENIPTRIDFETVDLTNDDATVVEPNQLYIMQSTRAANVTTGSYEKDLNDHSKVTVTAPYFTINNVVLASIPDETFEESPKSTTTEDGNIRFCGTQINQTTGMVPARSYVLGANDGKWHHTVSALPIKGFRCWIATGTGAGSPAKSLTFAIDGTEEGEVTAIHGLEQDVRQARTDAAVYNMQGQKVAPNATNLGSLPAGIYIVNNKKVVIK
jgi:hypothetical protein